MFDMFKNIPAGAASPNDDATTIPGRRNLRISLTSACNLRCGHCHNEGQVAPWLQQSQAQGALNQIEELIEVSAKYGVESVKFSGGDPGVYRYFYELMQAITNWRARYLSIECWSISTNGVPFLNARKFKALTESQLTGISIGIDSIEPDELSKPSSEVGISGAVLIDRFVTPLIDAWKDRYIKLNIVFTGNERRVLNVIRTARRLGINVAVIEINGVMGTAHDTRTAFLALIKNVADEHGLEPRFYTPLNQIYLYDEQGATPVEFYQDHCEDRDCGHCRKLHLRISPADNGWGAVPCFLQAQSKTIPLVVNGSVSSGRLEDAIRYNGRGPLWWKNTQYDTVTFSL
jgi:molybdenum cofactor biosynthesis enzyme MoaA